MTNEANTEGTRYGHEHTPRMQWAKAAPELYKAVLALEMTAKKGLDPALVELVKLRASQINHCAFCIDMHTKDAIAAGESVERLVLLPAWEEARHFYTERELAAIELTEAVTVLTDGFVPDEVYERAAQQFEERELAQLIGVIATINVWNRFGVGTRMVPGHYKAGMYDK
ncbi:carboxymuconolactone decarboxylase family protein [Streptomyces sp. JL4002]|uniref:carboxymuconolactone decarboxylase family protein n=1 Tax=Streptomyces TaxID=1883 RepID=UPI0033F8D132